MTVKTKDREAGDKSKGFRLQRLRAINLLLEQMEKNDENISVFASTEYLDDVYIKTVSPDGIITYTEGDKNYDPAKRFSFMSNEVTNSLIIFLDNWLKCELSETLYFCFYTNVEYTKEKNSPTVKKLSITLPSKAILEYLVNNELEDDVIECIKKRLLYEYEEQYKNEVGNGYLEVIKKFTNERWISFLSRINWKFGQYDDKKLEKILVDKIKNRSFLGYIDVTNKEDLIIDLLTEKFSANEQLTDPLVKHVTTIHVENIFLRISKDLVKKDDPIYDIWETLIKPSDTRGIQQKVIDVDPEYNKLKLGLKARDIVGIIKEYQQLTDQEKGSYRYRVFEACQRKLVDLLTNKDRVIDIDVWLEELFEAAKNHIEDKSRDYSYAITSDDAIKGAILELIDSCFLSFDEEGFYYGSI
ncbi:hypothetical protein ACFVRR_24100 [Gottfriedia sp. NPDC057948]|uniref:hypothetical protein n=1 Tax=Gottfriedia sp. NPDC057948 TaxID=3346287 RepID=UPI0036DD1A3E